MLVQATTGTPIWWRRLLYGLLHLPVFFVVSVVPAGYVLAMNVPSNQLGPILKVLQNSMVNTTCARLVVLLAITTGAQVITILNLSVNELVRSRAANFLAGLCPQLQHQPTTNMWTVRVYHGYDLGVPQHPKKLLPFVQTRMFSALMSEICSYIVAPTVAVRSLPT